MAEKNFNTRMQQKIDTTENWGKAVNFVPKKGEIIVYSDGGGVGIPKMKVGDGATKVGSLKFIESDGKLSTGRKISLGTAVNSTATEFDGSKDITIPVNSVSASYLRWGGRSITGAISPIDAALSYMHSANRLQFAKPEGITVEYSTNSGSTWTDYGASNKQKIALVSGLGKNTSGTTATTDALRITLNATNCGVYTIGRTLLINFMTAGATGCKVKIETSNIGASTTFTDRGSYDISGWSGWNSYPIDIGAFGGGSSQTWQIDNIRLTFTIGSAPSAGQKTAVLNLLLFGEATWSTPSNMARTGHIYDWDINQNAIFPGKLTATNLKGALANSFNFNGKTFDNTAPVNFGTIGIAYGGTAASTRKEALTNLLGQQNSTNLNEVLEQGTYRWTNDAENTPTAYGTLISLLDNRDIHDNRTNWLTHIAVGTNNTIYWRQKINSENFTAWKTILDSNNYSTYAATKDHNHDGTYLKTIPIASSSTLGGVKIGSGLTIAEDGTISAAAQYTLPTASSSVKGGIKVGTGLTMSSETLNHSNSVTAKTAYGSTSTTASANGGSITVTDIKYDAQGHITGSTDRTITLSQTTYTLAGLMGSTAKGSATQPIYWNGTAWTNTTHTLGKSVPADAKFTDTVYTLPAATSTALGGVKVSTGLSVAIDGTLTVASAPKLTTGRNITIGNKTLTFDGSAALTYSLADIGAVSTSSLNNYMPLSGGMFTGGVQFSSINYPVSWTAGASSDITVTLAPKANTATASQHLYLPLKTGTLATCSKSATLLVEASTWSDNGQATLTLPESYDGLSHTVVISPNPDVITDADTYAAYAAAKIIPSFSTGTSLVLHAYGTVPTVDIQIIITQID